MMKLRSYPEYKTSGVDWLGDIPDHWICSPGLSVLSKKKVKNIGMQESRVLSLSYGRIVIKPEEKLHGLVPESFETYQIVEPNDIIIRPTDLQNDFMSLRVGQVKDRGIITSAYICLVSRPPITRDYCYSLLNTYDLMKVYYGMGSGLRQNLDFADFRRLPVLIPSTDEQRQIVRFLDAKTRLINRFIRNKRRLIKLLQEQKQAVINDCVTGKMEVRRIMDENGNSSFRLQPSSCKMRDSGIDWLGEIPEHWAVKRFKHLPCRIGDGIHATPDYVDSSDIYFINGNNLGNGKISTYENTGLVNEEEYSKLGISLKTGAILISINGTIGNLAIYRGEKIILGKSAAYIECPNHIYNMFVYYYLQSSFVNDYFELSFAGTTIDNLSLQTLRKTQIPVPLLPEQKRIVEHLDQEAAKTNQLIEKVDRQIDRIQEYRTRLIADVVTGKVDVRGIPVEDVAEDEALEELVDEMDEGLLDEDEYEEES